MDKVNLNLYIKINASLLPQYFPRDTCDLCLFSNITVPLLFHSLFYIKAFIQPVITETTTKVVFYF